jgi:ElaB/YqjD/DUF883 family membrane-anchored ribosome-binding protein
MARLLRKPAPTTSLDLSEIGRLLLDLERGVSQLSTFMSGRVREVGSTIPDRLSDTLADITDRLRTTIRDNRNVGEEAVRMGQGALHRLEQEVVQRPLVALAVAAGIGFVIGALNNRSE